MWRYRKEIHQQLHRCTKLIHFQQKCPFLIFFCKWSSDMCCVLWNVCIGSSDICGDSHVLCVMKAKAKECFCLECHFSCRVSMQKIDPNLKILLKVSIQIWVFFYLLTWHEKKTFLTKFESEFYLTVLRDRTFSRYSENK